MDKMPEGFPLEPKDSKGNEIKVGDTVKILVIPEWLTHDLLEDDAEIVKSCEGEIMKINEIDDYGYAWLCKATVETDTDYHSNCFSIEPKNLLKTNVI